MKSDCLWEPSREESEGSEQLRAVWWRLAALWCSFGGVNMLLEARLRNLVWFGDSLVLNASCLFFVPVLRGSV